MSHKSRDTRSKKEHRAAELLQHKHNMSRNQNRAALDKLGVVILSYDLKTVEEGDKKKRHFAEKNHLVGLSRFVLRTERRIVESDLSRWIDNISCPRHFDLKELILEGGVNRYVESIKEDEEFKMKLRFKKISQIGIATARKMWEEQIQTLDELRDSIEKELEQEGLSESQKLKLRGQLVCIDDPPEDLMSADTLLDWIQMHQYMVREKRLSVRDAKILGAGSLIRGRLAAPDGEAMIFSKSWNAAKVDSHTKELIDCGLIETVLFAREAEEFDFQRDLYNRPPLGEGVAYRQVIAKDPLFPHKRHLLDLFFAPRSAEATAGFMLQSSAAIGDAAVHAALKRKHVLRPIGLIPLAEWNRCKELSEQGEVVVPTFEPVEDQQDLCRKIDIPYFLPADRHGNTAKDGYALRGISDEELEARAKEEAESVMRMEVDGEEDEEGEEAWVDEGEDKKGKGKAKGGKKKKRTMATPQRRPVPSLPTSKTRKRPRPRGSSPSPTARKKTKTRTVTNKRERGVELEVESGGKKRRVGPSRKAARRGASIEIYDDSSDLTELEESEEEEEDITRSRGGKGKNSSKVGQNSKGVGMKDSTGGNEDSGTGRRRSPRGKAGVKK